MNTVTSTFEVSSVERAIEPCPKFRITRPSIIFSASRSASGNSACRSKSVVSRAWQLMGGASIAAAGSSCVTSAYAN
jgi:hypothetical protein